MLRAGVTVLCAAVSCQAFHVPIASTSSRWLLATPQQHACQKPAQKCHSRRSRNVLDMTAVDEVAAKNDEKATAAVGTKPAASATSNNVAGDVAGTEGGPAIAATAAAEKKTSKPKAAKRKKRPWTPQEKAYLGKLADVPTIYKRNADEEFYPSVGYESSYPSLKDSLAVDYTGDSTVVNEDGKKEVLMRVVVVGGGEEEGKFISNLSKMGSGKLVDGLYVLWDPREGELSETVAKVKFVNVHELGSDKTRDPTKVAQHANFLSANMLVAAKTQYPYGSDYVARLKKAALDKGVTFVGPALAAEVAEGEMSTFTKLVEDIRAAM